MYDLKSGFPNQPISLGAYKFMVYTVHIVAWQAFPMLSYLTASSYFWIAKLQKGMLRLKHQERLQSFATKTMNTNRYAEGLFEKTSH